MTHYANRRFLILGLLAMSVVVGNAAATRAAPPVVFVPGTGGSELHFEDETRFWLDSDAIAKQRLLEGRLGEGGSKLVVGEVLDSVEINSLKEFTKTLGEILGDVPMGLPVYRPFLKWAREEYKGRFYEAPYDWRLGACGENSLRIDLVVAKAQSEHPGEKVVIIAHSLGGLVAREYLATIGKGKVKTLIAAGTPWIGAPKVTQALTAGYDFGVGVAEPRNAQSEVLRNILAKIPPLYYELKGGPLDGEKVLSPTRVSFVKAEDTKTVAASLPASYQMLPNADYHKLYAAANDVKGETAIYGKSAEELHKEIREANPELYDAAKKWRTTYFDGESHGVKHVLIGATCKEEARDDNRQAMQFVLPDNRQGLQGFGQGALRNNLGLIGRAQAYGSWLPLHAKAPVYLDQITPHDVDPSWGDGTTPLLSATLGALVKLGGEVNATLQKKLLGNQCVTEAVQLAAPNGHMTILIDESVKQILQKHTN